jgi:hypothetical protein
MTLIDSLYNKRFCLPSNGGASIQKNCLCGNYNHIACIFLGKGENLISGKKINILSYGTNQYADVEGEEPTIHAEYDAISRLPPLDRRNTRNLYICNIFVTRLSKSNKWGTSKPCHQCIHNLMFLPQHKGYRIKNVYYTDRDENIIKERLHHLIHQKNPHYTRYYRKRGDFPY